MINLEIVNRELSRFISLIPESSDIAEMKMPSCVVDEFWHHIDDHTEEFIELCVENQLSYVGHQIGGGYENIGWVPRYEEKYGELHRAWFTKKSGEFDSSLYADYMETGRMICSWDCGPAVPRKINEINGDIENLRKIREINRKIDQLEELGLPILDNLKKVDETTIVDSIKEKVDRFKIDEIRERNQN